MEQGKVETRKVQKLGYSTLIVSIPKKWVDQVGLKQGDLVAIHEENDATLRLVPRIDAMRGRKKVKYVINTDLMAEKGLIERILTGNYILGHDTIQLYSHKGRILPEHMEEVRDTVNRISGLGIVEQFLNSAMVQSFIDPTKFPLIGLMRRLYTILSSMLDAAVKGAVDDDIALLEEVNHMEDEADRLYWLIIRQLLLSQENREVAKAIGIEMPLHIIGNRTVAKALEEAADKAEEIAQELLKARKVDFKEYRDILLQLEALMNKIKGLIGNSMSALFNQDIFLANTIVRSVEDVEFIGKEIDEDITKRVEDTLPATIFKTVLNNLIQIAKHLDTIAEITVNRALEKPSEICEWQELE